MQEITQIAFPRTENHKNYTILWKILNLFHFNMPPA